MIASYAADLSKFKNLLSKNQGSQLMLCHMCKNNRKDLAGFITDAAAVLV